MRTLSITLIAAVTCCAVPQFVAAESLVTGLTDPAGIAIDPIGEKIYWVDQNTGALHRAGLDGANPEVLAEGFGHPFGIGVDSTAGRVYWGAGVDCSTCGEIWACDVDDCEPELLVSNEYGVRGVAVAHENCNGAEGCIVWATECSSCSPLMRTIRRAALDGTNVTTVLGNGWFSWPRMLAIDTGGSSAPGTTKVYVALMHGYLLRVGIDGTDQVQCHDEVMEAPTGLAVDAESNAFYWSDWHTTPGPKTINGNTIDCAVRDASMLVNNLQHITGLAIDKANDKIYWSGRINGSINSGQITVTSLTDQCPDDPNKREPGICGCGVAEQLRDADTDGVPFCLDGCPNDSGKTEPGVCGCGTPDIDSDSDLVLDCLDDCPADTLKSTPGVCGCGVPDFDSDNDGTMDCVDPCPCSDTYVDANSNGMWDPNEACSPDTPEERVCTMFYDRAPLPKPHYDSSFLAGSVVGTWAGSARQYIRICRAATLGAALFVSSPAAAPAATREHVLAANALEPNAIPATFNVDYIPWGRANSQTPKCEPDDLDHPYMTEGWNKMETFFQSVVALAQGNPGPADDIAIGTVFFQFEQWPANKSGASPAYRAAVTARANEAYLLAKQYFPNAPVVWYHRGEVFWGSGAGFNQGLMGLYASGGFPDDALGDAFATSLYTLATVGPSLLAYQYQMNVEYVRNSEAYGFDDTSPIIPVLCLGAGYAYAQDYAISPTGAENGDPNGLTYKWQLDYQPIYDFNMGRFINLERFSGARVDDGDGDPSDDPYVCPYLSPVAPNATTLLVARAEWNRAPFVVFWPSLFHAARPSIEESAKHFNMYFQGAVDDKCRSSTGCPVQSPCTPVCNECGKCVSCGS